MKDDAIAAQIDANLTLAKRIGARVTPSFVVGRRLWTGGADDARWKEIIDAERHSGTSGW